MTEPTLAEKVTLIHRTFETAEIPHAIGGALALAYYGEPRVTIDVDVNLFVPVERADEVLAVLGGIGVDATADRKAIARDEQVRLWWGRNPVDLFFAYDPFHDAMRKAARTVPFGEGTIQVLAPEHLLVCKVLFDRVKDWIDIEQVLVGEAVIDSDEIETWLTRMVGENDDRLERFHELRSRTR
ncbi:MAG: hypothetical protein M9938_01140 [Solirubrobacterales bacterium]|nr:hypothetical protein [Solirubrobacterales bacterium]